MSLAHWQQVEREARRDNWRGLDAKGLSHPDECPKLVIHGVKWAIPSRKAELVPTIREGEVSLGITSDDQWATADTLIEDAPIQVGDPCPTCGQDRRPYCEVLRDNEKHLEWLRQMMELVCQLLDVYYALSPEQKQGLLSFPLGHTPEWPAQVLDWCRSDEIVGVA